jgi:hypothetical protein
MYAFLYLGGSYDAAEQRAFGTKVIVLQKTTVKLPDI